MIFADASEVALPLELVVNQLGVGGVTGLTPTVAVRLAAAGTPLYLDWSTGRFLSSGWATKYQAMTEVERGHYQQVLDVAALGLPVGTKLVAEYNVTGAGAANGDDAEEIFLNQVPANATLLRKALTNRLEESSGNPGHLVLYDDDGVTPLRTWPIRDESGGAVLPAVGTPARRGAAT